MRWSRVVRSGRWAAGVCAALVVTACGGQGAAPPQVPAAVPGQTPLAQVKPLADPRGYTGPTTAVVAQPDIQPVAPEPKPALPVTVTDFQGTKVTVSDASRILAFDMSGTLAATVFGLGLGDRVIGRDVSTGFPGSEKLPVITANGHQLNGEAIMALKPTVVLTDTSIGPWNVVLQLRDAHVPVVVVDSKRSMDNTRELVGSVAAALGVPAAGKQLADRIDGQIARKKAEIAHLVPADPAKRPRVAFLYVRGQAGVYYMFGKGSGVESILSALGVVDVAAEAGIDGMRPINPEALSRARPDLVLMMTKGLESVGGVDGALAIPGLAQTPAAKKRRFVDLSDYQILSFGPLTASVLDALARAVYAPDSVKAAK
ncbi:Hemin-binding periplasmic protein HmuT precursor [Amycolatopsis sp. M39]|uniref:Iron complex transport system substrate-binding protein n=1 Tax=Amycolatopsis rubida TaxID=112413 RepID=A0A1I6AP01_9PSEU|nr:Hemin-binding periplasmic protein HmuT precursor [Amycolatopsis sp. M39]SFQ70369.1 iron complex transport system substrate-binding protein [Amycolatopsis rubida]